jgi:hypothetical protein
MSDSTPRRRAAGVGAGAILFVLALAPAALHGQGPARGAGPAPAPTPKDVAPLDLTGYWVSVVTEDWRYRMVMPRKGDFDSVPLNREGRRVAETWQPDQAGRCEAFGAGAGMRAPGRLHVTWENDTTLRIDTDAGQQTRRLAFAAPAPGRRSAPSWQGTSVATWDPPADVIDVLRTGGFDNLSRGAAGRLDPAAGGHHEPARRLAARQRGAVQRECGRDRALHAVRDAGRCRVVDGQDGRRRPHVPGAAVHGQHQLQAGSRWFEVESEAVS